ncbi:MAG: hypothetical protein U5N10_06230 [Gemmobacter sp.]|nr:hypothetical protein [Gemmobacter sp.]
MMMSKSKRHPNGLGNASDQLGRNIMDHFAAGAGGEWEGFDDMYYFGRRANGITLRVIVTGVLISEITFRGFGYQGGASRGNWGRGNGMDALWGCRLRESLSMEQNLAGFP